MELPAITICLTMMGRERPGMVAAVTRVLYDNGCNIRDSTMTILGGEFVMLLIADLPESMTTANLDQVLQDAQRRFDLAIFIKRLSEEEIHYREIPGAQNWRVTIYGGDRKGIVYHIASLMARKGVSITEMKTKGIGRHEGAGLVIMKIAAPADLELESFKEQINQIAERFGVDVSIG